MEALLADRVVRLVDEEGRPLTEQADPDFVAAEASPCRYPDRRRDAPINRAALEQVGRHWNWIRQDLRRRVPPRATLRQAFQASLQAVCSPLLWPTSSLPGRVAARYKACVGFCQVFCWLLLEEEQAGERTLAELGDRHAFFDWLEAGNWLLGERQACAGSRKQIGDLFDSFCSGQGVAPCATGELEVVALQTALVLSTYASMRQGGSVDPASLGQRLLCQGRAPWLFAVLARPAGQPHWARRMLPRSQGLERFLDGLNEVRGDGEREQLFWEAAEIVTAGLERRGPDIPWDGQPGFTDDSGCQAFPELGPAGSTDSLA